MDFIKIRFADDFDNITSSFEKTIEDMFRSLHPAFSLSERSWKPQMDIYETPEEVIVIAEIAGVDKKNLGIEISSKAVKIHGERTPLPRVHHSTYRLAEIQYGRFERILFLPALIDIDVVSASYTNGFLHIRLAKLSLDRKQLVKITDI